MAGSGGHVRLLARSEVVFTGHVNLLPRATLMFVLSRQPGESVVIGESAVLTVSVVGQDFGDILVRTVEIPNGRLVTLGVGRLEQIVPEVFVVMIRRVGGRLQLGIESPKSFAVQRIDA